jgi:hypothetical protein
VLVLHYSGTVAACTHILQVLIVVPTRTSCRPMITLTSDDLETCACKLRIGGHCCKNRPAKLFFMFKIRGPKETAKYVVAATESSR